MIDRNEYFSKKVNLMLLIDHAGRAGNGFFLTIFDKHPEVISCPWIHYIYSYIIDIFGEDELISCDDIFKKWINTIYFSLIYKELDKFNFDFIKKIGGDPNSPIDRKLIRSTFNKIVKSKSFIKRSELVKIIFFCFAIGTKKNLDDIKYILCSDSISLKSESAMKLFSGKLIDIAKKDFPKCRLIHLIRDPRAGIASSVHQFINQLGNMYGIKITNFIERFIRLIKKDLNWDSVFVFGF